MSKPKRKRRQQKRKDGLTKTQVENGWCMTQERKLYTARTVGFSLRRTRLCGGTRGDCCIFVFIFALYSFMLDLAELKGKGEI